MSLRNYIGGDWVVPGEPVGQQVCDANTGEPVFEQARSSADQLDAAIALADATHRDNAWLRRSPAERAADLSRVADEILARGEAIAVADACATGVIISLTRQLVQLCAGAFRQAAELAADPPCPAPREGPCGPLAIERLPLGPVAVIAPWNAPAGIACHKTASALAAGCPVLLKPSEWAPESAQLITEAVAAAGLPPGMLQLLHGDGRTGAALCADPRVRAVSFTGGLEAGRAVAAACAHGIKPAQLELGGNNPLLVLDDGNIAAAAEGVVRALTTLNGQWCRALGRLLVHRSLQDELIEAVSQRLAGLRIGSSLDPDSQMGPLVSRGHRARVQAQLQALAAQGGTLIQPTALPDLDGWFLPPTLVTGLPPEQTLEEIFGPVAVVHAFDSDEEAIALANQTPFGLAAYVFAEEDRAWRVASRLRSGMVKINAVTLFGLHPEAPRAAWGLSGLGDEGKFETYEFFRGSRVIGVGAR